MTLRTEAQKVAHERNWKIFRLRSCWYFFRGIKCLEGMQIVDRELTKLGAEPEEERREKRISTMMKAIEAED